MKPQELDGSNPKEIKEEKKEFGVKIGRHLRKLRDSKGMSQEQLSMQAGYYRTYVNKIEQGYYSPSLHTIWRLSHTLGMNLEDFFKGF